MKNDCEHAIRYWLNVKQQLSCPDYGKKTYGDIEFALQPREFELARAIINAELRHLVRQRPTVTTHPAN